MKRTVYTGTFISIPSLTSPLLVREDHAVGVDEEGVIRFIEKIEIRDEDWPERRNLRPSEDRARDSAVLRMEKGWGWGRFEDPDGRMVERRSWWFPGFVGECDFALFAVM